MTALWRAVARERRGVLGSTVLAALTAVGGLGLLGTAGALIVEASRRPSTILLLLVPIALVRFFSLLKAGARYGERLSSHQVGLRVLTTLRLAVFERLWRAGGRPATTSGDWLGRLTRDIERLQGAYLTEWVPAVGAATTAALVVGVTGLKLPPPASFAAIATVGAVGGGLVFVERRRRTVPTALTAEEAGWTQAVVELAEGLSDVVWQGSEDRVRESVMARGAGLARHGRAVGRLEAAALAVVAGAVGLGAVAVGAAGAASPRPSAVWVTVALLLVLSGYEFLSPLAAAAVRRADTAATASRIFPAEERVAEPDGGGIPRRDSRADVVLERLGVRYPGQPYWVLKDVSAVVPAEHHVQVVGPSGSGKSTLLAVLAGLIPYQQGRVLVGGEPPGSGISDRVTLSLERDHLFRTTVADNLRIARPAAADAALWDVLEQVGLAGVVADLPRGLDTVVGEAWVPSGGEARRLALARVLLRDTAIVLLDEPLVGLPDPDRDALGSMLARWARGRTVLVVTHRPIPTWRFSGTWRVDAGQIEER